MEKPSTMKQRREERRRTLGIDSVDRLTWKEWSPGEEYVRTILIKNIDRTSQTIKLSLPMHRKIFLTPFPEPVTLSSGVAYELRITFRPAELMELHDAVTITVEGRGSFQIHMDCLTPYAKLSLPSNFDFDYCAVGSSSQAQVQLRNSGTAPVEFTWEAPAPFRVLPSHAVLDQGEELQLTLLFTPAEACVLVGQAVCRLSGMNDPIAVLQLSGIGKYPAIAFEEAAEETGGATVIEMEARMGGPVVTRELRLFNSSPVPANVRLLRDTDAALSGFTVEAVLPSGAAVRAPGVAVTSTATAFLPDSPDTPFRLTRGGSAVIRIQYSPGSPGALHQSSFELACVEGNALRVLLQGTTTGPRVIASTSGIDFGVIDLERIPKGKQRTRHLNLRNLSSSEAVFNWNHTAPGAAFVVQPCSGVLPAQSTVQIAITFDPAHPILYHRRLLLLVEGATDVVAVDVLGGAYNSLIRPPTLTLADVGAAQLRAERGLGVLTPPELESIALAAAAEDAGEAAAATSPSSSPHQRRRSSVSVGTIETWRRIEEDVRETTVVMHAVRSKLRPPLGSLESLHGIIAVNTPFALDAPPLLNFGSGGGGRGQHVTVLNTSSEAAVATWRMSGRRCPYTVSPAQHVVPPHGSAVFQLHCSPVSPSSEDESDEELEEAVEGGGRRRKAATPPRRAVTTLECYVNFESMSAFYLAPDGCVVPPRCFTVTCTGAPIFSPARNSVAPLPPSSVSSPPPAQVRELAPVCLPQCRLGAASYQILALQNPANVAARYVVASLVLKHVSAVAAPPGTIVFNAPATADGAASSSAANSTTVSPEVDVEGPVFTFIPATAVMAAGERLLVLVKFHPSEAARYEATATLSWGGVVVGNEVGVSGAQSVTTAEMSISAAAAAASPSTLTMLSLLGEVCLPQLQWRTEFDLAASSGIVFPPTCITGEARQQAWLRNGTTTPLMFHTDTSASLLGVLRTEPAAGMIAGGAEIPLTVFFSPQQARTFDGLLYLHVEDVPPSHAATTSTAVVSGGVGGGMAHYRQQIPMRGVGAYAEVEVEPRVLDLGEAVDTSPQTAVLTLYNSGYCEVQYEVRALRLRRAEEEEEDGPEEADDSGGAGKFSAPVLPQLYRSRGLLSARTHTTVLASAQPTPGLTEYMLYAIVSGLGTDLAEVPDAHSRYEAERLPHCRWRVRAAHPAVRVVAVELTGVPRPLAWQQLSLNTVNLQLGNVACREDEADYGFAHYVRGLTPITMDLGVAHLGDAAAVLTLTLRNTGDCPAPFVVLLPTAQESSEEHWGLENTELADLQHVVDHGLLTITPAQGNIGVGDSVQLTVVYVREEVGVHRLPMLLRIGNGERRVAVVIEGRTLPPEVRAIEFHHPKVHELLPVALGDMEPPLQYVTVSNPFADAVAYSVDVRSLQEYAQEHYGFPIFQCADPVGVIPAGESRSIGFYFRPLEARVYELTVLIQLDHGEGYHVELVGTGYHPRHVARATLLKAVEDALGRVPLVPSDVARHSSLQLVDDVCRLGAVPYYSLTRRACTLQLQHDALSAMRYRWQSTRLLHGDGRLTVSPCEGVLHPGEQVTFHVSFYAGSTSQVLQRLLVCEVSAYTDVDQEEKDNAGYSSGNDASRGRLGGHRATVAPTSSGTESCRRLQPVSLLLQTRVMPRNSFEELYGTARLNATYMPALYACHVDPQADGPGASAADAESSSSAEATSFVSTLLDELFRDVVATSAVQAAFTTPCPPPLITYAAMRAAEDAAAAAAMGVGTLTTQRSDQQRKATGTASGGAAVLWTEDVLEELLRDLVDEVVSVM